MLLQMEAQLILSPLQSALTTSGERERTSEEAKQVEMLD